MIKCIFSHNEGEKYFERPPERVTADYQSNSPLLSSKMAYLRAFRVPTNCIQKAMFDSGRRGGKCPVDISSVQILSHRLFYARKLLINKRFPGFLFMLTSVPYFWRVTNLVTNLRIFSCRDRISSLQGSSTVRYRRRWSIHLRIEEGH